MFLRKANMKMVLKEKLLKVDRFINETVNSSTIMHTNLSSFLFSQNIFCSFRSLFCCNSLEGTFLY